MLIFKHRWTRAWERMLNRLHPTRLFWFSDTSVPRPERGFWITVYPTPKSIILIVRHKWTQQAWERMLNASLAFTQQYYHDFQTQVDLGLGEDGKWQFSLHPTILSWFSDTSGPGPGRGCWMTALPSHLEETLDQIKLYWPGKLLDNMTVAFNCPETVRLIYKTSYVYSHLKKIGYPKWDITQNSYYVYVKLKRNRLSSSRLLVYSLTL